LDKESDGNLPVPTSTLRDFRAIIKHSGNTVHCPSNRRPIELIGSPAYQRSQINLIAESNDDAGSDSLLDDAKGLFVRRRGWAMPFAWSIMVVVQALLGDGALFRT
jgi:hypothetical protein